MKRCAIITAAVLAALLVLQYAGWAVEKEKLPEIGSIYVLDRAEFYVRGVGDKPFEYRTTGESLVVKILKISGTMVFVPKKGQLVKVDTTIPMIWIDGKEKPEFRTNSYLKKNARNKIFLLLEYKR